MRHLYRWIQARPDEWALLAVLLVSYPLGTILPPAWASEGSILENMQVIVLLGGFALAMLVFARARPSRIAMLALWVAPIWLVLAARELSWGRAWLPQPVADAAGHVTPLWYQSLFWPAASLLLAWLMYSAWRHRVDEPVRSAFARRTPWLCFIVMLGAAMGSTCAEGHMSCHLDMAASQAQVIEESTELVAYLALCAIQNVVFMHHARASLCRDTRPHADANAKEAG